MTRARKFFTCNYPASEPEFFVLQKHPSHSKVEIIPSSAKFRWQDKEKFRNDIKICSVLSKDAYTIILLFLTKESWLSQNLV